MEKINTSAAKNYKGLIDRADAKVENNIFLQMLFIDPMHLEIMNMMRQLPLTRYYYVIYPRIRRITG